LGPGGGVNGGRIIAEGPPERIADVAISATGQYLKPMLERASVKPKVVETKPKKPSRARRVPASDDEDELGLIAAK
jgi:excinuclease ABC subunit A